MRGLDVRIITPLIMLKRILCSGQTEKAPWEVDRHEERGRSSPRVRVQLDGRRIQ
jgi:hypothetical protein